MQHYVNIKHPIDSNLTGSCIMRTQEIKINNLLNKEIEYERNFNQTHFAIQILLIITP